MAAIAAVLTYKCVGLQPATTGSPEVVDLEEVSEYNATNQTLHNPNQPTPPKALTQLTIDKAAAQGLFKIGRSYKTEFTLIALP